MKSLRSHLVMTSPNTQIATRSFWLITHLCPSCIFFLKRRLKEATFTMINWLKDYHIVQRSYFKVQWVSQIWNLHRRVARLLSKIKMENENNVRYGPETYNFKEVTLFLKIKFKCMFNSTEKLRQTYNFHYVWIKILPLPS